ncbi:MAG: glutaredoxin family protein [Betaproteobacteria bacterium]|nr:glutaredoxin family protein [Betaproteobacteria bacterium]
MIASLRGPTNRENSDVASNIHLKLGLGFDIRRGGRSLSLGRCERQSALHRHRAHGPQRQDQKARLSGSRRGSGRIELRKSGCRENFPVSLYTAPKCGAPCDNARNYLNKRGVPYSEVSITDAKQHDELVKLAGGAELPMLRVGKQINKGFEASMYSGALDAAGYAKSAAPGQAKKAVAGTPSSAQPAGDIKMILQACRDPRDATRTKYGGADCAK